MNSPPPSVAVSEPIRQFYHRRVAEYQSRLDAIERQSAWLSRLRGLTFLSSVALAITGWASSAIAWPWFTAAAIVFAGFIALCALHENILQSAAETRHRRNMNRRQLNRLDRHWPRKPEFEIEVPRQHQSVSRDLDLFGPSSVYEWLSLAHTPLGSQTLREWLLEPTAAEEVVARQQAVALLSPDAQFRESLDLRGRLLGSGDRGPEAFVQWAEGEPWLARRGWLKWLTRSLSLAVFLVAVAGFAGLANPLVAWVAFLGIVAINVVLNVIFVGDVYTIFDSVSSRTHDIQHYRPLFEAIAGLPEDCGFFQRLQKQMGKSPREPLHVLNHLARIIGFADLRRGGLLGIPYILLQFICLTDFHVLYFLEIWQQRHGHIVRDWLETVGQLEAISSLATLAHDHPDWALPVVHNDPERTIEAKALGHPLLPDDVCVRNDVTIGPQRTFLLVTGSNMSGKSTLLRAIGVNVVLAQAGGPVCAAEFKLPPLRIATSMRIHDSLADGVSFFMAELKRLKQIVDQCREIERSEDGTLLYLLDEILQGTNSAERHIAVSQVIRHLVQHESIGVVSTHDLELANSPTLAEACRTVHFRENITGEGGERKMTFDYRMRSGVSPTTNALKLLELVGLAEENE